MYSQTKILNNIKYSLVRLVALLFVIYVLADVSILQAYCGNESAGIPPAHHFSQNTGNTLQRVDGVSAENQTEVRKQSGQDNQTLHDWDEEACFCCCSHVVAGYFAVTLDFNTHALSDTQPDTYVSTYSNSTLSNFFRPPRQA